MPAIAMIEKEDIRRMPRKPAELLPPDSIARLPAIFGLHGTTAISAGRLVGSDGFGAGMLSEIAGKIGGIPDAFYFYVASGRGFDFRKGWEWRVKVSEIRESILGATKAVNWYSRFSLKGWLEHDLHKLGLPAARAHGLGVVIFALTQEAYGKMRDDETIELKGDPVRGPFPKYIEAADLDVIRIERMGAVMTGPELSAELSRLEPDELDILDSYIVQREEELKKPEWERTLCRDPRMERFALLRDAFAEKIADILTGRIA